MSDTEFELKPLDIANINKQAGITVIPTKSGPVYEAAYQRFIRWCTETNIEGYTEEVLLSYFHDLETKMKMKSSTLWSQYSMIKSLLKTKNGIDISDYTKLRGYLKKQNLGYTPKKPKVFSNEQFQRFLTEAPDEQYLGMKVIMIIGVFGACRCDEMVRMTIDDVEDFGSLLHIKIHHTATSKTRTFTIVGEMYVSIYKKYFSLRPLDVKDPRLFLKFANGKCYRLVMGVHAISGVPKRVATFLGLPDAEEYTGRNIRTLTETKRVTKLQYQKLFSGVETFKSIRTSTDIAFNCTYCGKCFNYEYSWKTHEKFLCKLKTEHGE